MKIPFKKVFRRGRDKPSVKTATPMASPETTRITPPQPFALSSEPTPPSPASRTDQFQFPSPIPSPAQLSAPLPVPPPANIDPTGALHNSADMAFSDAQHVNTPHEVSAGTQALNSGVRNNSCVDSHNHKGLVNQGGNYHGPISGGIIGGKNNKNIVYNSYHISNPSDPLKSDATDTPSYLPMPCHNNLFTGRVLFLDILRRYFAPRDTYRPSRSFLAYGMGGAGKTQLCVKFVEEVETQFWRTFWVDATTVETMELSLRDIATDPEAQAAGVERSADSVVRWLSTVEHDWLIVFDNASDGDKVARYIPKGNRGNVLFTSRNPSLARLVSTADRIEVDEMEEEDAILLLLRSSEIHESSTQARQAAGPIVKELMFLPLAVDQAGAAIASGLCGGIDDYLPKYRQHRQKLLADPAFKGASGYGCAVYGTWDLSFTTIRNMGSTEAESAIFILRTFAFFHHENITEEIMKRAAEASKERASRLPPQLLQLLQLDQNKSWDDFLFREGIRILVSFSLVKKSKNRGIFSLHPLVHCWSRDSMLNEERQASSFVAATLISTSIEHRFTTEDHAYRRTLIPHINAIMLESQLSYDDERYAMFGLAFFEAGHWKVAEKLQVKVMEMRKGVLGEEHPDTLSSVANLAATYHSQGRWKEAEELQVQVMEMSKQVLGEEHPDSLKSMENLASTYQKRGQSKKAEELEVAVMEMRKRLLGEEHPDTLSSAGSLAVTYKFQGRWKEAEELEVAVMALRKSLLGEEHPETLISVANLASTYRRQGRQKEAEELEVAVMETRKRLLGEEHPDTLSSVANLAATYHSQGRWKEAEELWLEVMELTKRVFGEEHPDSLMCVANLGFSYHDQGRWKEAEELQVQVMEMRKRLLGEEHPDSLMTVANLAATYHYQGRWKEAEELGVQVMELRKRLFGEEHPDTLTSVANIAATYRHQGRWKEAEELQVEVMEIRKRVLGEEHPDSLRSMASLAFTYYCQGWWKEAEELQVEVLEMRKRVLGQEHPDTLVSMAALALTYHSQGRWKEAEELQVQVMEMSKRVLGEEHPDSLKSMENLASTYQKQGQSKEAEQLHLQASDIRNNASQVMPLT